MSHLIWIYSVCKFNFFITGALNVNLCTTLCRETDKMEVSTPKILVNLELGTHTHHHYIGIRSSSPDTKMERINLFFLWQKVITLFGNRSLQSPVIWLKLLPQICCQICCCLSSHAFNFVVVALLFCVHGKHLRSCRNGQLT